jgi:hypothetical protein
MALTVNEEQILKKQIELETLKKERADLQESMNGKIAAANTTYNTTVDGIRATDEPVISAKDADITAKEAEIDALL